MYKYRPGATLALSFYLVVWSSKPCCGGALRSAFLLNLLNPKKLCFQKEAETILPADFYNKMICTPCYIFALGKDSLAP